MDVVLLDSESEVDVLKVSQSMIPESEEESDGWDVFEANDQPKRTLVVNEEGKEKMKEVKEQMKVVKDEERDDDFTFDIKVSPKVDIDELDNMDATFEYLKKRKQSRGKLIHHIKNIEANIQQLSDAEQKQDDEEKRSAEIYEEAEHDLRIRYKKARFYLVDVRGAVEKYADEKKRGLTYREFHLFSPIEIVNNLQGVKSLEKAAWYQALKNPFVRNCMFINGMMLNYIKNLQGSPFWQEIRSWMLNELAREPDDDLRNAYFEILKTTGQFEHITYEHFARLFEFLGADKVALALISGESPEVEDSEGEFDDPVLADSSVNTPNLSHLLFDATPYVILPAVAHIQYALDSCLKIFQTASQETQLSVLPKVLGLILLVCGDYVVNISCPGIGSLVVGQILDILNPETYTQTLDSLIAFIYSLTKTHSRLQVRSLELLRLAIVYSKTNHCAILMQRLAFAFLLSTDKVEQQHNEDTDSMIVKLALPKLQQDEFYRVGKFTTGSATQYEEKLFQLIYLIYALHHLPFLGGSKAEEEPTKQARRKLEHLLKNPYDEIFFSQATDPRLEGIRTSLWVCLSLLTVSIGQRHQVI